MGQAMEILTGFTTAPSTTFTALTMGSGDSATVRNTAIGSKILLIQAWTQKNAAGVFRIRSARLHDVAQGIRMADIAAQVDAHLPWGVPQPLFPQDALILEQTGSAVGGKIEQASLLMYYQDLPGITARLANWSDIANRIKNIEIVEASITAGAAGGYSGSQAINVTFDNFKANTDYALLGGYVNARCTSVGIKGSDTGNLRVGFPGEPTQVFLTKWWFRFLSEHYGLPMIPIFSSSNKGVILVDVAQNDGGAAVIVSLQMAELGT